MGYAAFVLAVVALIIIAAFSVIVRSLIERFKSELDPQKKGSLANQIKELKATVEGNYKGLKKMIDDHLGEHKKLENGLRTWVQNELVGQNSKNENYVTKISEALDAVAKGRESLAKSRGELVAAFKEFLRAIQEGMKDEASPQPATEEKPADSSPASTINIPLEPVDPSSLLPGPPISEIEPNHPSPAQDQPATPPTSS